MSAPLQLIAATLGSEGEARRVLATLAAAGFVCVPREPTAEMLDAASDYVHDEDGAGTWRAMIEASSPLE